MSVLVIAKFQGDTASFRQSLTDRAGEYEKWGEQARAAGGIHHRFGIGDGFIVVSDEWESVEHFEKFFANRISPSDLDVLITGEPRTATSVLTAAAALALD